MEKSYPCLYIEAVMPADQGTQNERDVEGTANTSLHPPFTPVFLPTLVLMNDTVQF